MPDYISKIKFPDERNAREIKDTTARQVFTPATSSVAGTSGQVPAPTYSEVSNGAYLKADGTWDTPDVGGYPRLTYVSGDIYEHVTGASAPTWTANTYYSRSGSTYTVTSSEPTDWSTNWTDYYTKTTGNSVAIDYGNS